jgi:hypothetical protein
LFYCTTARKNFVNTWDCPLYILIKTLRVLHANVVPLTTRCERRWNQRREQR